MNGLFLRGYVKCKTFFRSRKGQAMTEYGLIIALIAVVLIVIIGALTHQLERVFTSIVDAIKSILPKETPPPG